MSSYDYDRESSQKCNQKCSRLQQIPSDGSLISIWPLPHVITSCLGRPRGSDLDFSGGKQRSAESAFISSRVLLPNCAVTTVFDRLCDGTQGWVR